MNKTGSTDPSDVLVQGELVDDAGAITVVRFTRSAQDRAAAVVWYVADLGPMVSVKRGTLDAGVASTVSHAPFALDRVIAMASWRTDSAAFLYNEDDFVRVRPLSPTQTEVATWDPIDSTSVAWQFIENSRWSVQRGGGSLGPSELARIEAVAEVDLTRTFARVSWRFTGGEAGSAASALSARLLNSTQLSVERLGLGGTAEYTWEVVSVSDATRVLSGRSTIDGGTSRIVVPLVPGVDPGRAVAFLSGHERFAMFDTPTTNALWASLFTARLTGSELELERAPGSSLDAVADWVVLEFPDLDAGADAEGDAGGRQPAALTVGCSCASGAGPWATCVLAFVGLGQRRRWARAR